VLTRATINLPDQTVAWFLELWGRKVWSWILWGPDTKNEQAGEKQRQFTRPMNLTQNAHRRKMCVMGGPVPRMTGLAKASSNLLERQTGKPVCHDSTLVVGS
jgi:hypothetical protein